MLASRGKQKAAVTVVLAMFALGAPLIAPVPAAADSVTIVGRNLIANGDAESGAGSPDGSVVPVPGWTTIGNFTVAQYGGNGLPSFTDPGPSDRGANFFAGGPNNASSSGSQLINVASAAHQIDVGAVTFALSGFLGGFADQGDNAVLSITFKNGDQVLGSAQIGPVTAADRGNATGPLARSTSGAVPVGTREILVVLQMTRAPVFFYNDGYADNLNLTLTDVFGRNLITNGDAESGAGSPDGSVVPVPGWTTIGNFTVAQYGGNGLPSFTDPGPSDRGANFFAGGPNNASSSGSQLINVASAAHQIDVGAVTFTLSGFLGGFADQGDNAVLSITFKNGDQVLGSAQIGPVTAADRGNATGLLARSTSGAVPVGTREILVVLQMTRAPVFFYNDGYADNLNLTLTDIFGRNLIANGDAESGAGSPDGSVVPVPGWTTNGNFTVAQYGANGLPSFTDPGPSDRGANFFAGGPNNASSAASQLINVASAAHQIDVG